MPILKININLAAPKKGGSAIRISVIAGLSILAIVFTWFDYGAYSSNKALLNAAAERLSAMKESVSKERAKAAPVTLSAGELEVLAKKAVFVNSAIISETFSWTELLTRLEENIPSKVFLVQISPDFRDNKILVTGMARSMDDVISTVDRLGASAYFKDVYLLKHYKSADEKIGMNEERDGSFISFNISARFGGAE